MNQRAIILFTQQTQYSRGKQGEPFATISWEDIDFLFSTMLHDTLNQLSEISHTNILISVDQLDHYEELTKTSKPKMTILDHVLLNIGQRVVKSINHAYTNGYTKLLLIFSAYPLFTNEFISNIFEQLNYDDECTVCGMTPSGKLGLIGMRNNYARWFSKSTESINLNELLLNICNEDILMFLTQPVLNIESGYHLETLRQEILQKIFQEESNYSRHTHEAFKFIEKKYSKRKTKDDEAWNIRRHL